MLVQQPTREVLESPYKNKLLAELRPKIDTKEHQELSQDVKKRIKRPSLS